MALRIKVELIDFTIYQTQKWSDAVHVYSPGLGGVYAAEIKYQVIVDKRPYIIISQEFKPQSLPVCKVGMEPPS